MIRIIFIILSVILCVGPTGSAVASTAFPNILGRWTIESDGILIGNTPQWPKATDPITPRLAHMVTTLVIEHQSDDLFWGEFTTPTHKQFLEGAFTGQGNNFLIVGEHGIGQGYVISAKKLRWCYMQSKTKDIPAEIVGCNNATRE